MKRIFLTLFALLLAMPAYAGSNIRQKDTGATVWEEAGGTQVPVGDSGLTVLLENISSASTAYVISNKTGNVVKIYSVAFGATTVANAVLDFGTLTGGVFTAISGAGGIITIAGTGAAGDIDSVTFTPGTSPDLDVNQGEVVWVTTDGGSTGDVDAVITFIIE